MLRSLITRKVVVQATIAVALCALVLITFVSSEEVPKAPATPKPPPENDTLAVAPPPFSEGIFPCSNCHDNDSLKPNPERRPLKKTIGGVGHKEIDKNFKHDEENRWCLDCHDLKDRDKLHLASGKLIDFTESYKLCGQCHGPTLRDWKAGEHGKRTGFWSGYKRSLLCAHCHNPHSPHFKPLEPLPAPPRPETIR
ncbi:MAG TPA: hypothetical protein VGP72_17135 [Planctomycetota bacterium]|jgi:hypothetical protein